MLYPAGFAAFLTGLLEISNLKHVLLLLLCVPPGAKPRTARPERYSFGAGFFGKLGTGRQPGEDLHRADAQPVVRLASQISCRGHCFENIHAIFMFDFAETKRQHCSRRSDYNLIHIVGFS